MPKRIIITGSAGFIGSALTLKLLESGHEIIGVDNINNYYDPQLKVARLNRFISNPNYRHFYESISDLAAVKRIFSECDPDVVVNLAAQAGVRYSIENPMSYVESNLIGFMNILETCRHFDVSHLVYASSSSVYGANTKLPFSVSDSVDHPLSLYAATKKSNESLAHSYSHLYGLPTTGLRFFTVYGPWGRPDMALYRFTKSILSDAPIDVYNYGEHRRDFTYIDDIVAALLLVLGKPPQSNEKWESFNPGLGSSSAPWRIFNIGSQRPVSLMDFIKLLENNLGKKARINYLPMQDGDVPETYADIDDLKTEFGYLPETTIEHGIKNFVDWYVNFYSSSG